MVTGNCDEFTQLLRISSKSIGKIETDMQDRFVLA